MHRKRALRRRYKGYAFETLYTIELLMSWLQGFRKYLTQSKDHEELLSFLLGGLVKDKARFYQLQRHEQPELVTIQVSELEERVSLTHKSIFGCRFPPDFDRPRNTIFMM